MNKETLIDKYKRWEAGLNPSQTKLFNERSWNQSCQWLGITICCGLKSLKGIKGNEHLTTNQCCKDAWRIEFSC